MIAVIDYKVGNVKSVCNAFAHIGCEAVLTSSPEDIENAGGIVLPGVASFGYAVRELGRLAESVVSAARQGRPLLGICVGYQLLFDSSCELGSHRGLGLIEGDVVNIPSGRVIPHMGWNQVKYQPDMGLFSGLEACRYFYFAHSYYSRVSDSQAKAAFTEYDGVKMAAFVQKENVFGTQFHPEKSGPQGLKVLKNFASFCGEED